jgi:putative DNA primase/helicase
VNSGRLSLSRLTSRGMQSEHFQWLRSGVARAQKWDQAHPAGVYFRCTPLHPEGVEKGRGGERDAHALTFLWADVDYGTVGHKPGPNQLPLPPDEEAARKIIAALPIPPSMLIHSGGGFYPLWLFERPVRLTTDAIRAEAKARSQHWQEIIRAKAGELGWHYGSGVGDLARVLRLPGSVNRKVPNQPRACRVIEQSGEVFPW